MPRLTRAIKESRGLINTTDLLVATAATVVLASAVGGAAIGTLNESKYGKAQPDAQTVAGAISAFYKDTGKWPGQAEQIAVTTTSTSNVNSVVTTTTTTTTPAQFLVTTSNGSALPSNFAGAVEAVGSTALSTSQAVCQNNSLEGFVGVTISAGTVSASNVKNINDYLVRKPSSTSYQNWKGPYLQADIKTDPWDRDWVLNLQPLYCSEDITTTAGVTLTRGQLGYAWLLSGGSNRTVSTAFGAANVDPDGDDAGMNMGKLVKRGAGGLDK